MKTMHLPMIVITGVVALSFLLSDNTAHGIWIPQSPQELLNDSETIFVGNITSVNTLQLEQKFTYVTEENGIDKTVVQNYTLNLDQYQVNVEEFLKNPPSSNKMTVRQPTIPSGPGYISGIDRFKVGDRVLFYVQKLDGNNTYSPESFVIPKVCTSKDVLTQERFEMGNEFFTIQNGKRVDNFTANKPIQFVWNRDVGTLSGKSYDVLVYITKSVGTSTEIVFNKEIHAESKSCQWIASTVWEFTPQPGHYGMDIRIRENGTISHLSDSEFSVKSDTITSSDISPLKQLQSGIKAEDVKCDNSFQLILKGSDTSPACIMNNHVSNFLERPWATRTMAVENAKQSISYSIVGDSIATSNMDAPSKSLFILINAKTNGTMIITIPRELLDTKTSNMDNAFIVLEDGREASYKEIHKTIQDRTLSIPFQNGTVKIEVIAPQPI